MLRVYQPEDFLVDIRHNYTNYYTLTHTLHELESGVGDEHVTGELSYDA